MSAAKPIEESFLTIESNGFGMGTKITLPDGTDLTPYVRSIAWAVGPGGGAAGVTLEMMPAKLLLKMHKSEELMESLAEAMSAAGFEIGVRKEE